MTYINHYCSVPATPEGIDMLENHLKAGNQAVILTAYKMTKLTKRNIGYVSLSDDGQGFWIGYKHKTFLFASSPYGGGYLRLVEPGYGF